MGTCFGGMKSPFHLQEVACEISQNSAVNDEPADHEDWGNIDGRRIRSLAVTSFIDVTDLHANPKNATTATAKR